MKVILKIIHNGYPLKTYECLDDVKKNKVKIYSLMAYIQNWPRIEKFIYNGFEVDVFKDNEIYKYCFDADLPQNFYSFLYEIKGTNKEEY